MRSWGDGMDSYRKRLAAGESRASVVASLEDRRRELVDVAKEARRPEVMTAIRQTDEFIREVNDPRPTSSDAW